MTRRRRAVSDVCRGNLDRRRARQATLVVLGLRLGARSDERHGHPDRDLRLGRRRHDRRRRHPQSGHGARRLQGHRVRRLSGRDPRLRRVHRVLAHHLGAGLLAQGAIRRPGLAQRRPRDRACAGGARLRRHDLRRRADQHAQGRPAHLGAHQAGAAALRPADARAVGARDQRRQVAQHGGAGLSGRALRHAARGVPRDHRRQVQGQGGGDRRGQRQGVRCRLRGGPGDLQARLHRARPGAREQRRRRDDERQHRDRPRLPGSRRRDLLRLSDHAGDHDPRDAGGAPAQAGRPGAADRGRDRGDLGRDRGGLRRRARGDRDLGTGPRADDRDDRARRDGRGARGDLRLAARRPVHRHADQDRAVGPQSRGIRRLGRRQAHRARADQRRGLLPLRRPGVRARREVPDAGDRAARSVSVEPAGERRRARQDPLRAEPVEGPGGARARRGATSASRSPTTGSARAPSRASRAASIPSPASSTTSSAGPRTRPRSTS